MASFNVFKLVAVVAGFTLATPPAEADNNDIYNFAINIECLEVRLQSAGSAHRTVDITSIRSKVV